MSPNKKTVTSIEDLDTVVCADFHLSEGRSELLPYLEEPWDEYLDTVEGERTNYSPPIFPGAGLFHPGRASGRIRPRKVTTVEDVREGMEMLGIDEAILSPGSTRLGLVHHDELATAVASAYNGWIADVFLPAGFSASLLVAPQRPREAAEEIASYASTDGVVAATIPVAGLSHPLGDRRYDPIYEACEDADLPILLHGNVNGGPYDLPFQNKSMTRHMEVHTLEHPVVHMVNLTSMATHGVFVRFPELRFVFQESGLGWVPYVVNRLDHEYPMKPEDAPLLDDLPSRYIYDSCYFSSQPVEGANKRDYVGPIARMIGPDSLLFASDYPHHDFDESNELLMRLKSEFSPDEVECVYAGNALDLFDLR